MAEEREDPTLAELHERNRSATTPVAVRLPEPLLAEIDAICCEREYESRSEFIRTVLTAVAEDPDVVEAASDRDDPFNG